jgi:hypothetical protein
MKPQTIKYEKGCPITLIEDSKTLLINCSNLQWGKLYPPTILVEGIEEDKTKFDFFKAYKNNEEVVVHCEYRSTNDSGFKLIVHTQ